VGAHESVCLFSGLVAGGVRGLLARRGQQLTKADWPFLSLAAGNTTNQRRRWGPITALPLLGCSLAARAPIRSSGDAASRWTSGGLLMIQLSQRTRNNLCSVQLLLSLGGGGRPRVGLAAARALDPAWLFVKLHLTRRPPGWPPGRPARAA
jgi:hypothetical protein